MESSYNMMKRNIFCSSTEVSRLCTMYFWIEKSQLESAREDWKGLQRIRDINERKARVQSYHIQQIRQHKPLTESHYGINQAAILNRYIAISAPSFYCHLRGQKLQTSFLSVKMVFCKPQHFQQKTSLNLYVLTRTVMF